MKRKILTLFAIILGLLLLVGCAAGDRSGPNSDTTENIGDEYSIIISQSNRKIIYKAHLNIKTKELLETSKNIKNLLVDDDYIEREELTANYTYITFRIKTTRLDAFVSALQSDYETTSFKLESTDISLQYQDISERIVTYEKERDRLRDMYDSATIYEMIEINQRLSVVETELLKLNNQLQTFDSLVEFSTVYLYIYGPKASPKPPYGTTLKDTFVGGWNAVLVVLKGLLQVIVAILPFLLVIVAPAGGIVVGSIYLHRRRKKKNNIDDEE